MGRAHTAGRSDKARKKGRGTGEGEHRTTVQLRESLSQANKEPQSQDCLAGSSHVGKDWPGSGTLTMLSP